MFISGASVEGRYPVLRLFLRCLLARLDGCILDYYKGLLYDNGFGFLGRVYIVPVEIALYPSKSVCLIREPGAVNPYCRS